MATTYTPIATQTVSNSTTVTVTFSSIPSTYTDLIIVTNGSQTGGSNGALRFNGDTSNNYSNTYVYGDGSSTNSGRATNQGILIFNYVPSTGDRTMSKIMIQNYANSTTYKTTLWRRDDIVNATQAGVGLWRSTAAINQIDLLQTVGSSYWSSGTTFTLYGIQAA